jgi:hypothetical protein
MSATTRIPTMPAEIPTARPLIFVGLDGASDGAAEVETWELLAGRETLGLLIVVVPEVVVGGELFQTTSSQPPWRISRCATHGGNIRRGHAQARRCLGGLEAD